MAERSEHNETRSRLAVGELHHVSEAEANPTGQRNPAGKVILNEQPTSDFTSVRTGPANMVFRTPIPEHIEQLIRRRAYELYERRGRVNGHAEEDWRLAEAEILGTVLRRARTE